ncbi:MAG: hypothetical protein Q9227_006450 [Pyrenula ochraceoflavens]
MASVSVPSPLPLGSQSPLSNHLDPTTSPSADYPAYNSPRESLPPFQFGTTSSIPTGADVSGPAASAPKMPPPGFQHARQASRSRRAPPLPDFSFNPGAELKPDPTPSPTHPILEEMASNLDSAKSAKPAALPPFSFNPGSSSSMKSPLSSSPTKTGFGEMRAGGHRRRGSEFVGSEATPMTSPSSFSTSPAKSEIGGPTAALTSHLGPPPGKRHSHRRSEAVSISDVEKSNIIKESALSKHRAGSAPSTPADSKQFFEDDSPPPSATSFTGFTGKSPPSSPNRRQSAHGTPRPRVGFSETVDLIPRPLSLISSETEDSASTIRHGHSLTGSINSLSAISPPAKSRSSWSLSAEESSPRPRPRTADGTSPSRATGPDTDVFEGVVPGHRRVATSTSENLLSSRSESSPAKKKHFWSGSISPEEVSPKTTPAREITDPLVASTTPWTIEAASDPPRPRTSPERKVSIKKRKVKTLTTGIFSRKAKARCGKAKGRRTPTPPLTRSTPDPVFDDDNTVIIRESPPRSTKTPTAPSLETSPFPPTTASSAQDWPDVSSPVIDLDAALGPFGSEEKIPQTGFAAARARLHSGGIRSATDAFGNVHRRTESAPHLPPPNRTVLAMHRYGSNSSMGVDETLDEEEEDDYLASKALKKPSPIKTGATDDSLRVKVSDADERSPTSPTDSVQGSGRMAFAEGNFDPKDPASRTSDSTVTASDFSDPMGGHPPSLPVDYAYQSSPISYASSGDFQSAPNSAISFADTDSAYDAQARQSHLRAETHHGSRRISTEDVPSLSDSVSTATGVHPRVSGSVHTRSSMEQQAPRSFSESAPAALSAARASKRASLASLSRLIPGSSHGEKSKLRFGESATDLDQHRLPAAKKSNRISRMIHFWRPKEKDAK